VRFKRARVAPGAGGLTKVTLKPPGKKTASVRRALRKKRLVAKVTPTVNDVAGNRSVRSLKLRLR
jgi:hypothetical protein